MKLPSNLHICFPIYLDGMLHKVVKTKIDRKLIPHMIEGVDEAFASIGEFTTTTKSNEVCLSLWKYLRSKSKVDGSDLLRLGVYHAAQLGEDLQRCKAVVMFSEQNGSVNMEGFTSMSEYRETLEQIYNRKSA